MRGRNPYLRKPEPTRRGDVVRLHRILVHGLRCSWLSLWGLRVFAPWPANDNRARRD